MYHTHTHSKAKLLFHIIQDAFVIGGLLYMGCSPDARCLEGTHGLHSRQSLVCMKLLLNWGADPNATDDVGNTILHMFQNDMTLMQMVLEHEINVNAANNEGLTPLHVAAKHGLINSIDLLMEKKADPQAKTLQGNTPYDIAALFGHSVYFMRLMKSSVEKEREKKSGIEAVEKWTEECRRLTSSWKKFRHDALQDLSTEQ